METSHKELMLVKETPYDFQTFSLDSSDYKSRRDSIKQMFSGMETLFTSFGVSPANLLPSISFLIIATTDLSRMVSARCGIHKERGY